MTSCRRLLSAKSTSPSTVASWLVSIVSNRDRSSTSLSNQTMFGKSSRRKIFTYSCIANVQRMNDKANLISSLFGSTTFDRRSIQSCEHTSQWNEFQQKHLTLSMRRKDFPFSLKLHDSNSIDAVAARTRQMALDKWGDRPDRLPRSLKMIARLVSSLRWDRHRMSC